MSARSGAPESDETDEGEPFAAFARENREWLEKKADSDAPAAWVAAAILNAHPEDTP